MRDLYGKLIDGMQGVRGAVRSGGDEGGLDMAGLPLAEVPLAVYSGPLQTDANGNAQVTFTLPAFNGTMRLAAQVWSASKLGHGEKDVIVRDTVVAQATPPKFLMLGDTSTMHLSIENVEAPAGTYKLTAKADGGMEVTGPAERELTLGLNKRIDQTIGLKGASVGDGHVFLRAHREWRLHRAELCDPGRTAGAQCAPPDQRGFGLVHRLAQGWRRTDPRLGAGDRESVGDGKPHRFVRRARLASRGSTAIRSAAPSRPRAEPCRCSITTRWLRARI